jgi:uncharacterized repeat protein (TIGR01451 family)
MRRALVVTAMVAGTTAAVTVITATPAAAATISSGGPLTNVTVNPQLNCDVRHASDTQPEWYGTTACGTLVALNNVLYGPATIPAGGNATPRTSYTQVSQSAVTGAGTAGNPYQIVTTVNLGTTGVQLVQTDRYITGQELYGTEARLVNTSGTVKSGYLYTAGDCFLQNSDFGFGRVTGGSPACIANQSPGSRVQQLLPATGGNTYLEAQYSTVWSAIGQRGALPNTCECSSRLDNGIALAWPVSLAAGASRTIGWSTVFSPTGVVPLAVSVTAHQDAAVTSSTDGYRLTVSNPNTTSTTISTLTLTLPASFSYRAGSTTGITTANPAVNGRTLTWTGPFTVPIGGAINVDLDVNVGTTAGTFTVDAAGTSPDGPVFPINTAAPIRVRQQADLRLAKAMAPATAAAGTTVTATLTATNDGPAAVTNAVVTDTVPAGFTLRAGSDPRCSQAGTRVTCPVAAIAAGSSAVLTLVFDVGPTAALGAAGDLATVTTDDQADPNLANNSATGSVSVTRLADLAITTSAPAGAVPGQDVTYTLTARNNGPSLATTIRLTEVPAPGYTVTALTTAAPSGVCTLAELVCRFPQLTAGESVAVTVTGRLAPSVTGQPAVTNLGAVQSFDVTDPNTADNQSTVAVPVTPVANLAIAKSGPTTVTPGSNPRYELTVSNLGPSDATDVLVTDTLATTVAGQAGFVATPACTIATASASCTLARVEAGGHTTFVVELAVPPDVATGTALDDVATVSPPASIIDPDPANNSAGIDATATRSVDLALTKTASTKVVDAGTPVAFTLSVTNRGPSQATAVTVTDPLPTDFTAGSATVTAGAGSCTAAATVVCTFPVLEPGATATVVVSGTVDAGAPSGGALTNTATAAAAEIEDNPLDNSSTVSVDISATTGLDLVATSDADEVAAGAPLTYTFRATNAGPSEANGVVLTAQLPADLVAGTPTADRAGLPCTVTGGVLTCPIGDLDVGPGETVTVTLPGTTRPATPPGATILVSAVLTDDGGGRAESADATLVFRQADLSVTKTHLGTPPVAAGATTIWSIAVHNDGPSVAEGATLVDAPGPGVQLVSLDLAGCTVTVSSAVCALPPIGPGATFSVLVTAQLSPDAGAGSLTNGVTVSGGGSDPTAGNDTAADTIAVDQRSVLTVATVTDTPTASAGRGIFYAILVTNTGPSTATGLQVVETLPPGLTLLPDATSLGCTETAATPQVVVTCTGAAFPPELRVGQTVELRIGALVAPNVTGTLTNSASATAVQAAVPVVDTVVAPVSDAVDLDITKAGPATAVAGTAFDWTATVTNRGPAVARDVVVTDAVPGDQAVTGVSITPVGTCTRTGNDVSCTVTSLPPAGQVTVTITATAIPEALPPGSVIGILGNTAGVTSANSQTGTGNRSASTDVPVTQVAHVRVAKNVPATPVIAGAPYEFTMEVANGGPGAATGIVLVDTLPPGLTFVRADQPCAPDPGDAGRVVCALAGPLPAGDTIDVAIVTAVDPNIAGSTLVNTASVIWDQLDPTPDGSDSSDVTFTVAEAHDLVAGLTAIPGTVIAGDDLAYTVTARNDGPSTARNVVLGDVAWGTGTATPAGGEPPCGLTGPLPCSAPDLAPGDAVTVTVPRTVPPGQPAGPLAATVSVSADGTELTPADTTATATVAVVRSAELAVSKIGPATITPGDPTPATWLMTVTNEGPSDATDVVLTDQRPPRVTIVTMAASQGICDPAAGTCALGTLAVHTTAVVTVTATVAPDARGLVVNTASATSTTPFLGTPGREVAAVNTAATPAAGLTLAKAGPPGALPGQTVTYVITVGSTGPSTAGDVVVDDPPPPGLTFLTATASQGSCVVATGSCALGALDPGSTATVAITAQVAAGATGSITNAATVTSPDLSGPPPPAAVAPVPLQGVADVALSASAAPASIPAGGETTITVAATNAGPDAAPGTVVTGILPPGVVARASAPTVGAFDPGTGTWTVGDLAPGATASLTVTAVADATGELTASATATTTAVDTDPTNNSASFTLSVAPVALPPVGGEEGPGSGAGAGGSGSGSSGDGGANAGAGPVAGADGTGGTGGTDASGNPDGTGSSDLPVTGGRPRPLLLAGAGLLAAGLASVAGSRSRRRRRPA